MSGTRRLYYDDCYQQRFTTVIIDQTDGGRRVYLAETAFYPTSGGQPFDRGTLGGVAVLDVVDEDDRIAHVLAAPLPVAVAEGVIDWPRRFDHMQQHTAQHLLSAVLAEEYGARTISFHLGEETCTIDLAVPELPAAMIQAVEERCQQIVCENRPVTIEYAERDAAGELRKESARTGLLRIISIAGLDRNACGGTHLRATGEVGPVLLRRTEKVRGQIRLEFAAGLRASRQARREYEALAQAARVFSAGWETVPEKARTQQEQLAAAEKKLQKLMGELAQWRAQERYATTAPDADGQRRWWQESAALDEWRSEAQAWAALPGTVAVLVSRETVLLAASSDSGHHVGSVLKTIAAAHGGRGGGSAGLAQGHLPPAAVADLRQALGFA